MYLTELVKYRLRCSRVDSLHRSFSSSTEKFEAVNSFLMNSRGRYLAALPVVAAMGSRRCEIDSSPQRNARKYFGKYVFVSSFSRRDYYWYLM